MPDVGWLGTILWVGAALAFLAVAVLLFRQARRIDADAVAKITIVPPARAETVRGDVPGPHVGSVELVEAEAPPFAEAGIAAAAESAIVDAPLHAETLHDASGDAFVVVTGPAPEHEPETAQDMPAEAVTEPGPLPEMTPEPEIAPEDVVEADHVVEARSELEPEAEREAEPAAEPEPEAAPALQLVWPTLVDPDAGPLDEATRRAMIEGLALLGGAWSATILARAAGEETADLAALAREALGPALDRAYADGDLADRFVAIAIAARAGRTPLLGLALADSDDGVALSAARGLARAGRLDLVAAALVSAPESRVADVRRILSIPDDDL